MPPDWLIAEGLIEQKPDGWKMLVATTYSRGHTVVCAPSGWRYFDNGDPAENDFAGGGLRDCAKCGQPPTPEGYDPCIGYVEGAFSVCCGHGVEPVRICWPEDSLDLVRRLVHGECHA